jgi:hypothetical protein
MIYLEHQQVMVAIRRGKNLHEQAETSFRMGLFGRSKWL